MRHGSVGRDGSRREGERVGLLVAQVGLLGRHRAYRYGRIVSPRSSATCRRRAIKPGPTRMPRARIAGAGLDGDGLDDRLGHVRAKRTRLDASPSA